MKTMNQLKKVVALGMGLTMVGATLFGASAVKLSDWPSPFVVNGVPASNLAVVFGDSAVGADVAGAGDIVTALQQAAVVKTQVAGAVSKVSLKGNAVEVGTPNDILELNETVGDVRNTFTEFDLPLLKGSTMSTQSGATKVNQYFQFPSASGYRSNKVIFDEDEFRNVGTFLFVNDADEIVTWVLEFEEGLKSTLTGTIGATAGGSLDELTNRKVNILGTEYIVAKTEVHNGIATNQTLLTFLGGKVRDQLGEGDKKTYTVDGKEYQVEVVIVSESNNEVILKVNGENLPKLRVGETEPTSDGLLVGLVALYPTAKDTQSSVIDLAIGATKLILKDNWGDTVFTAGGLTINNEVIEDDSVRITLTNISDQTWVLSDIKVNISANGLVGNIFVPPGHGIREYLDEPESLVAPGWDIRYEGMMNTGTTLVRVTPSARDEYKLEFTNQEGLKYAVPIASERQTGGTLRRGEFTGGQQRDLIFFEANISESASNKAGLRNVNRFDYFIVSDITTTTSTTASIQNLAAGAYGQPGASTDNVGFTHILKYEQYSSQNRVLSVTDLASGTKEITIPQGGNTGQLIVGGTSYQVELDPATGNSNFSLDVNGDGTNDAGAVAILAAEGGLLMQFQGTSGGASFGQAVQGAALTGDTFTVSFSTLAKQYDEGGAGQTSGANRVRGVLINGDTAASIRMNKSDAQNLSFIFLTSEPEIAQYVDDYGAQWELFSPTTSNTPEELTLEYPLSQRGVQVFLTAGDVQKEQKAGGESQKINPLPVGVSKLSSEVSDIKKLNAIVVGGPCANPVAADLLGKPDPCTKGFEKGKALVKLFEHGNGNVAVLVAGFSGEDTRRAARALLTNQDAVKKVDGKEAVVTGTSLSDVTVKAA